MAIIPPMEFTINETIIRQWLTQHHPDLAQEPLALIGEGWDNVNYRLGENMVIRLPRSKGAVALLEKETVWLRMLPDMPIPIPRPIHQSIATEAFPWPGCITPLYEGGHPVAAELPDGEVLRWVYFLKTLHAFRPEAPMPENDFRSQPLITKASQTEARFPLLTTKVDADWERLLAFWDRAKALDHPKEQVLIHGDLHPKNVLIHHGRFSAVLDWGDMCGGDCATDLDSIWMLIANQRQRALAMEAYGMDEATQQRAMGWAFFIATVYAEAGLTDDPSYLPFGLQMLSNIESDIA